ncbi:hypothetical protein HOA55_01745 [archaeon]|jgi:hypothetical protein|nr:hypothetical protein [archaeon]MBT3577677.1 hypothetical protein [archaeon]MBT6820056.1 hypothetical protein [archaeon]MBT6956191.1 hypothetical protein [archaeon]MBT7025342.1 hypothetical protein [archaeon]
MIEDHFAQGGYVTERAKEIVNGIMHDSDRTDRMIEGVLFNSEMILSKLTPITWN